MSALIMFLTMYTLILCHELGHFLFAKSTGVRIHLFQIGLIPVFGFTAWETKFKFGLLPILGFVEPDEPSYNSMSYRNKILLALSGPMASSLLGCILLVASGRSIIEAGLAAIIIPLAVPFLVVANPSMFVLTAQSNNLAATVGMAQMFNAAPNAILQMVGILSLSLAGINLIPMPPLDGGRALFDALESMFGKVTIKFLVVNGKNPPLVSVVKWSLMLIFLFYTSYTIIAEIWFAVTGVLSKM